MSEMVLRLPNSYVEVEMDEMEYVDGGFSMQTTKVWGIPIAANLNFSNGDLWALSVGGAGIGIAASYGKQLNVQWTAVSGITQFKFY